MITKQTEAQEAEALWAELRGALLNLRRVIEEIITTEAWLPLGYGSFAEAWLDRAGGLTFPAEVRPMIAYRLLEDGQQPTDVAGAVKGLGVATAKRIQYERSNGTSMRDVGTVVRAHVRSKPAAPRAVHLEIGELELQSWKEIAKQRGTTVTREVECAARKHFRQLARER